MNTVLPSLAFSILFLSVSSSKSNLTSENNVYTGIAKKSDLEKNNFVKVVDHVEQELNIYSFLRSDSILEIINNRKCKNDLKQLIHGMSNEEKWAMTMFDASVKYPYGLLSGNTYQFGNFDECISVEHEGLSGQYCLVNVITDKADRIEVMLMPPYHILKFIECKPAEYQFELKMLVMAGSGTSKENMLKIKQELPHTHVSAPYGMTEIGGVAFPYNKTSYNKDVSVGFINVNMACKKILRTSFNNTLYWALCIPSSCQPKDLQLAFNSLFKSLLHFNDVVVEVPQSSCYHVKEVPFNYLEIIYGSIILLFLLFVLISTLYHVCHIYRKINCSEYSLDRSRKDYPTKHEVILAFSLIRNVSKIIEMKVKNNDFNLDCLSGIKTISMGFILAGHALFFSISSPSINSDFHNKQVEKLQNAIFLNNPLLVDSFLLVSGFLMCRLLLLELEKTKGKINVFIIYLGRYFRLIPSYLVVIGFYTTGFIRTSNGPLWEERIGLERDRCLKSWWTNLLFVNNYVNTDYLCMFQSWYLSVDTQLFFLAPIIIYPLWLCRRFGEIILSIVLIISAALPFIFTYIKQLDPTLMIYAPEMKDLALNHYFKEAYIKTHMRSNAYFIGLLYGYLVHRIQSSGIKLCQTATIIGWTLAVISGITSLFSITIFYQPNYKYNLLASAFYAPLHRIGWCVSLGWIILICVIGKGGFVNNFLSWKVFAPLSRLTYCAYLVNGIVELYCYGNIRVPRYLSIFTLVVETGGHIILTVIAAFILCALFESPIHNLEKIIIKFSVSKKQKPSKSVSFVIN